ncbi:MAG: glutaredoxin family protein [Planctomycetota bacterium]
MTIYTIPEKCPLCDEAKAVLARIAPDFTEVDIRTDRELLRAYRNEIPVVTVDGVKRFVGRVDPTELARFLKKY